MQEQALIEELHSFIFALKPKHKGKDLSMGESMILSILRRGSQEKSEGLNPSMLSEQMGISRSAITPLLNSLEKKGYIERSFDPNDRRQVLIKKIHKIGFDPNHREGKIRNLLSPLNEEEKEALYLILKKINLNLQEKTSE